MIFWLFFGTKTYPKGNFCFHESISSIFLTEVNFDTSEGNQLSYFQNGLFFKILLSFHEPHNQVKYRWKNEVFSELFTNTFFEIIFVTFVSNKSLRCLYHTWIVFWKSDFWMIFVYTNHSASLAIHASIALRNSKKVCVDNLIL